MKNRTAWWAVGGAVASAAGIAVVSGIPRSPLTPILPPDGQPLGTLRWLADISGLSSMGPNARGAVAMAAVALAVLAFSYALREAWRGRLSVRAAIGWGLAFNALAFLLPVLFSHDVYHYSLYGRIASVHGGNPFVDLPIQFRSDPMFRYFSPDWRQTPALYGPLFVQISVLFTKMLNRPGELIHAFKALSAIASVAAMIGIAALAKKLQPRRAAFATVAFGWNPIVLYSTVGAGHFDTLIALCVVLALSCLVVAKRSSPVRRTVAELGTTAFLTLAALLKTPMMILVVAGVAVAVLSKGRGRRLGPLLLHGAVVAALVIPITMPFLQAKDPTLGASYLTRYLNWLAPSSLPIAILKHPLSALGFHAAASAWVAFVRVVFSAALIVALVWIGRAMAGRRGDPTPEGQAAAWAWIVIMILLTAPIVWPWYVVWILPLIWLCPAVLRLAILGASVTMPVVMTTAERSSAPAFVGIDVAYSVIFVLPVLTGILVWLVIDLRHRVRGGIPLEAERASMPGELLGGLLRDLGRLAGASRLLGGADAQARRKTAPSSSS